MKESEVRFWHQEITLALKREEKWRKQAKTITELYEKGKAGANAFNILWSNTETLLPAVYNNLPRPVVSRRFKDPDPLGMAAGQACTRLLEYTIDCPDERYPSFDSTIESAVLGALVPGRGVTWFRYHAELEDIEGPAPRVEPEGAEGLPTERSAVRPAQEPPEEPGEAEEMGEARPQGVRYEALCAEDVPYDQVLFGAARRWKQCPWVARLHNMTREDLEENFGRAKAAKITCYGPSEEPDDPGADEEEREQSLIKTAPVWEVWHKASKRVLYVSLELKDDVLREDDDPLGLSGFFPCPEPLIFVQKDSGLVPTPLYCYYEEQARELNRVTNRINRLIEAMKVRGFYDASMEGNDGGLADLLERGEDNELRPMRNLSAAGDTPAMERMIYLMPVEKLIQVLSQLYLQRQQIKQVIYEITGISDILRGSSVASETATAQNIKNQWGTMRLRRMQRRVQRYVRDCLRLFVELAGERYGEETWAAITGMEKILPTEAKAQAVQEFEGLKAQIPMVQDPQQAQQLKPQLDQAAQRAALPSWQEVLGVLRSDALRGWRIDIETNSTIDVESSEDKKNITEVMAVLSQFIQGTGPMVQQGILPFPAAKAMLLTIVRRFRFGGEVEEELMKMQPPKPQEDEGAKAEQIKLQGLQAKAQADAAKAKQDMAVAQQKAQQEMALAQQKHALELERMREEHALAMADLALKREEMALKRQAMQDKAVAEQRAAQMRVQEAQAMSRIPKQPAAPKPQGGNGAAGAPRR